MKDRLLNLLAGRTKMQISTKLTEHVAMRRCASELALMGKNLSEYDDSLLHMDKVWLSSERVKQTKFLVPKSPQEVDWVDRLPTDLFRKISAQIAKTDPDFQSLAVNKSWRNDEDARSNRLHRRLTAATMWTGGKEFERIAALPSVLLESRSLPPASRSLLLRHAALTFVKLDGYQLASLVNQLLDVSASLDVDTYQSVLSYSAKLLFKCPEPTRIILFDRIVAEANDREVRSCAILAHALMDQIRGLPRSLRATRLDAARAFSQGVPRSQAFGLYRDCLANVPFLPIECASELLGDAKEAVDEKIFEESESALLLYDMSGLSTGLKRSKRQAYLEWVFDSLRHYPERYLKSAMQRVGASLNFLSSEESLEILKVTFERFRAPEPAEMNWRILTAALDASPDRTEQFLTVGRAHVRTLWNNDLLLSDTTPACISDAAYISTLKQVFNERQQSSTHLWYLDPRPRINRQPRLDNHSN